MHCPSCKTTQLVMSERSGVEIDYCPDCRGVWLDRGELDKIIDRASVGQITAPVQPDRSSSGRPVPHPVDYDHRHGGYYKKKKREGFLSDLFDF